MRDVESKKQEIDSELRNEAMQKGDDGIREAEHVGVREAKESFKEE